MLNPFRKQLCPKGGWRTHCGDKCLYNHYDDGEVDSKKIVVVSAVDSVGYKGKLRNSRPNHPKSKLGDLQSKTMENKSNVSKGFKNQVNVNITPKKGGSGLIGVASYIRRSPSTRPRFHDSPKKIEESILVSENAIEWH